MADHQVRLQRAPQFKLEPDRKGGPPWTAVGIGVVALAALFGVLVLLWHKPQPHANGPSAYAPHIQLQNIKLSHAETFVGGVVTFVEGQVTNDGDKTVTGATVEVVLKNAGGDTSQEDDLPLQVVDRAGRYPQALNLRLSPLKPQQQREFRLSLSRVAADWNGQIPTLTVMQVETGN